jgi:hypothetical protein
MRAVRHVAFLVLILGALSRPVTGQATFSCSGGETSAYCTSNPWTQYDCLFGTCYGSQGYSFCLGAAMTDCLSAQNHGCGSSYTYWLEPNGDDWDEYCGVSCQDGEHC